MTPLEIFPAAALLCALSCAATPGPTQLAAPSAATCRARPDSPDPRCTPGDVETRDLAAVCQQPTRSRRHVTETEKARVLAAYGMSREADGDLEIDHLVPLELGGSNAETNLWPEAAPAYHEKDRVENAAHRAVCAGRMDLVEAQRAIAEDWRELGKKLEGFQ